MHLDMVMWKKKKSRCCLWRCVGMHMHQCCMPLCETTRSDTYTRLFCWCEMKKLQQLYVITATLQLERLKVEIVHNGLIGEKHACLYMPTVLIVQHLPSYFEELCCTLRKSKNQTFCLWGTELWFWACDGRLLALQGEAKRLVHKFWLWYYCTYTCEWNTKSLCLCKLLEWRVKIQQYKLIKFMAL